jgi:hypothetical protein
LSLGAVACGNDNGGASRETPTADADSGAPASADDATKPATDEAQIRSLIASSQKAFRTGDGQVVCAGLTAAGQKDIIAYGKAVGAAGSCVEVVKGIAEYNRQEDLAQPPAKILVVRVKGRNAVVVLRFKGAAAPLRQRLQKVNGDWKQLPYGLAAAVNGL